jgi:hypothetical protein
MKKVLLLGSCKGNLCPLPPSSGEKGDQLFWIRKDLVRQRQIRPKDCYPVGRSDRFDEHSKSLSWVKDIWAGGDRATFVEALKKAPMADGGRSV